MTEGRVQVGILMGSDSDWPKIKDAAAALDEFGVAYEVNVMSAHRTPQLVADYATGAAARPRASVVSTSIPTRLHARCLP